MTITRVQGNARGTASDSGSSITVTQASAPANGNVNILTVLIYRNAGVTNVSSISQTGVTWNASATVSKTIGNFDSEIWLGTIGAGASATITVNLASSLAIQDAAIANVLEYSGLSSTVDKTATQSGSSTSGDTGTTATTAAANELWVGTIATGRVLGFATQSAPTNDFSLLDGADFAVTSFHYSTSFLEKIVSATGAANSGTTIATGGFWAGAIATFKASLNVVATDAVRVNDFATRRTTKATAHIMRITDAALLRKLLLVSAMLRITERAGVGYLRFITQTDAVHVADSLRRSISKVIFESVRVIDLLMRIGPILFLRFQEVVSIRESFMRRAQWIRTFTDAIRFVDKISGIARLIVGIAVAIKTLGYYIEKKLHPTQREGDTPVL